MAHSTLLFLMALMLVRGAWSDLGAGANAACLGSFDTLRSVIGDESNVNRMASFVKGTVCRDAFKSRDQTAQCQLLSDGLLPQVLEWLSQPATAYQFCRQAQPKVAQDAPKVKDATQCLLCEMIATQGQQILNNSAVFDKINETAQQLCTSLPADMAGLCAGFVNKYEPLLVALISHASAEELCQLLGVCPKSLMARLSRAQFRPFSPDVDQIMPTIKDIKQRLTVEGVMAHEFTLRGGVKTPTLKDSCDVCKMAVIQAHSLVVNPQIQQSLINYTETLCESFPSFQDTCKLYVDVYAPVVFSVLAQYLAPDTVCVQIGVCPPPSALHQVVEQMLDSVIMHMKAAVGNLIQVEHHAVDKSRLSKPVAVSAAVQK